MNKHTREELVVLKFPVTERTRQAFKVAALLAGKKTMKAYAMQVFKNAGVAVDPKDLET
jgi:hypothetical protein